MGLVTLLPFGVPPVTGTEMLNFWHTLPNSSVKTATISIPSEETSSLKLTIKIRSRILTALIRASRDVRQDASLADAVAVLIRIRAVD